MKNNIMDFTNIDVIFEERMSLLSFCSSKITLAGPILEFGVFNGTTINHLATNNRNRNIYGFDTFTGLPEDWKQKNDVIRKKGTFSTKKLPIVEKNVKLIKGLFSNTLPKWIKENNLPIPLIHIDSDLYSSAKDILFLTNNLIINGTIIVFDELSDWQTNKNYTLWEDGEWKALNEWVDKYNRKFEIIGRTKLHQAAIRIIS